MINKNEFPNLLKRSLPEETLLDNIPQVYRGLNRNYQKFIILSHQRSGSSMTIGTLRKHPQIIGFGELFTSNRITFNISGFDNYSKPLLYFREKYPVDFLKRYIFTAYRSDIKAVGFKLLPEQIDNKQYKCIWDWLRRNKDIKIIFLTRENLLASYTSRFIAEKAGKFSIRNESERSKELIAINFEECIKEFQKKEMYQQKVIDLLSDHDILKVTYEKMVMDLNRIFMEFQHFLKVDLNPLSVDTIKQEVRPLSKVITNYSELRDRFLSTKWKYVFEE